MSSIHQELIDTGVIFSLQGRYRRMARDLVEAGLCSFNQNN